MHYDKSGSTQVTVGTGLTEIVNMEVESHSEIVAEIKNSGGTAFNAFEVAVQASKLGAFVVVASAGGDFSTPLYPLRRTVGAPVTLANGATALLFLACRGAYKVRIRASVGAGTTTAEVHAQAH